MTTKLTLRSAYMEHYDKEELAPATRASFMHDLTRWEKFTDDPDVREINNETLAKFRAGCLDAALAPSTVNITYSRLRAVLRLLAPAERGNPWGLGIIQGVPAMKLVKVVRRRPYTIPLEDLSRFYVYVGRATFPRCELRPVEWWQLLIVLAYTTAMNAADLFALRWESIDLESEAITFRSAKTGRLDQFPLHPAAVVHLQAAREKTTTPLVLCGMYRDLCGFRQAFHRIQLDAGVTMRSGLFGLRSVRKLAAMTMEAVQPGLGAILTQHTPRDIDDDIVPNQKRRQAIAEGLKRLDVPNDWFAVGGLPEDGDDIDDGTE